MPHNPDYNPIIVTPHEGPEMVIAGEWVASVIENPTPQNVQPLKPSIRACCRTSDDG